LVTWRCASIFILPFSFSCSRGLLPLHSFPTRRSSDLPHLRTHPSGSSRARRRHASDSPRGPLLDQGSRSAGPPRARLPGPVEVQDRKSTRLNSSHVKISYAVFCLKKKKITTNAPDYQ